MSYVHGYSPRETQRLREQSEILEQRLHSGTTYAPGAHVLEIGCGVGAQTRLLLKRNPDIRLLSIDISAESLEKAREIVKIEGHNNVSFELGNVLDLQFDDLSFDHVFICFVLEHLNDPLKALAELKRVLKPGGSITVIEGDHGSCFWSPETKESKYVWNSLIRAQRALGHDPNIGRRLYPLLHDAGFQVEYVKPCWIYTDAADPDLAEGMVNKIITPMVNASKEMAIRDGHVDQRIWDKGFFELSQTGRIVEGTFFYTWFKGVGRK
jgi:SAM-dependent methyltransferase